MIIFLQTILLTKIITFLWSHQFIRHRYTNKLIKKLIITINWLFFYLSNFDTAIMVNRFCFNFRWWNRVRFDWVGRNNRWWYDKKEKKNSVQNRHRKTYKRSNIFRTSATWMRELTLIKRLSPVIIARKMEF